MFFSFRRHNRLVEKAASLFPIRFHEETPLARPFPWKVRTRYDDKKTRWLASMLPGLVNAIPAAVSVPFVDCPSAAAQRILAERAAAKKPRPNPQERVDVFLDEEPFFPLAFRRIGKGSAPDSVTGNPQSGNITGTFEKVPEYFKRLGVRDANPNLLATDPSGETYRLLAACDVVLEQPRVALVNQVSVGAVFDGSIVTVTPSFSIPPDRQPRIVANARFVPPNDNLTSFTDIFYGRFYDFPVDYALLATIYALSPYNPADETINQSWIIYVKQNIHWNLAHASRIQEAVTVPRQTLFTGLAAGLGDLIFNEILANNNDWAQGVVNIYNQNRQRGKFYAV